MMNAITGSAIFFIVMVMVVMMMVQSSKIEKKVERNEKIRK